MSVAAEVPPVVFIPERARRTSSVSQTRQLGLAPDYRTVDQGEAVAGRATIVTLPRRSALPQSAATPLRLTRLGTVAINLAVAVLGGVMLWVAHVSLPSTVAATAHAHPGGVVTVQSGDTLWSIANDIAPNRDPRAVVADLRAANHLSDVALWPGQNLKVG